MDAVFRNLENNKNGGDVMKLREEYTCPLEIVHDIIKGKWKTIILFQLRNDVTGTTQGTANIWLSREEKIFRVSITCGVSSDK